ncbi:hypothetical protein Tco_0515312 [Tanacetum coccineum]
MNSLSTAMNIIEDKIDGLRKGSYWEKINNKISLARFRIANLEQIIEDIQVQKELLDLSAGLSELNQCFPIATIPKTARRSLQDYLGYIQEAFDKMYCPPNCGPKMEDKFTVWTMKEGNDLKTICEKDLRNCNLCPSMMPDSE